MLPDNPSKLKDVFNTTVSLAGHQVNYDAKLHVISHDDNVTVILKPSSCQSVEFSGQAEILLFTRKNVTL